ncbi:MAG: hypothetical protein AB8G96_10355 [Phycisphaerales bacterium]
MSDRRVFTGRQRRLTTKGSVRFADRAAQAIITIGGIGTIIAVATVCLFLAAVVLPLFKGAEQSLDADMQHDRVAAAAGDAATPGTTPGPPVAVGVDEYRTIGWTMDADGTLTSFRFDTGETLARTAVFAGGPRPTAWSFAPGRPLVVTGFEDGTVRASRIRFRTRFLRDAEITADVLTSTPGSPVPFGDGMVERTIESQFRLQTMVVDMVGEPEPVAGGPILAVSHAGDAEDLSVVALGGPADAVALVRLNAAEEEDMFSGEMAMEWSGRRELGYGPIDGEHPRWVAVAASGRDAYAIWPGGTIDRWNRSRDERTERTTAGKPITAARMLLGDVTLVLGHEDGSLSGSFPVPVDEDLIDESTGADGFRLEPAHQLSGATDAPVRSIALASRGRMFVAGHDDGTISSYYMVSGERLGSTKLDDAASIAAVAISPKEDALVAATEGRVARFEFEPRYPEASIRTLFMPIWYEGYGGPELIWQSSAANDDAEPKLSLIPLIFGTLKATFYSMIFGAPVALLAAIYTSEFLNPKIKSIVKPTIELMASLPSVVLGFLAALVFAPYIERVIPATLAVFFTVPFVLLLGAFLWQLLPSRTAIRWAQHRIVLITLTLPIGVWLALALGPWLEALLFDGSLRLWLDGLRNRGEGGTNPVGGWVMFLMPVSALVVGFVMIRFVGPIIRRRVDGDRRTMATIDLVKFAVGTVLTIGLSILAGVLLGGAGFDVRAPLPGMGSFVDTFDQRNALVVGFVMGFAIIPIIYTIADDALSTVPDHLRGASLGAGATPWQTTVRIVVPTAMSGLFSALMIGLGRAVGETMIVLMALGNTPVMNANVFEGARTLSANLAVELPEAPIGSTHYRVLFLAALLLFLMTFVLNTIAESVRLRFRKRAYQL